MATLYSYSPEDVSVLVAGLYEVSGFVDGTMVSVSKDRPTFTTHESSDGITSRTHTESHLYTVTLSLHSAAQSNQVLSYLLAADASSKIAKFPIIIKDNLGTSSFFSPSSWIEGPPDTSFAVSITERPWVIRCSAGSYNVGGNHLSAGFVRNVSDLGIGYLDRVVSERTLRG